MGASQSANGGGGGNGGSGSAPAAKTSYYELLAVARDATEDEIKKAYRRKALELHPDRNYGNEEAATKTFAEIQAAYEVLSDPQERAWYDSHESAILSGDDGYADGEGAAPSYANIKITTADDLARLVRKFNSNVEFTDAPSGFFGFVRETFEHLAQEEEAAARAENTEANEYPIFGHREDAYDDVVRQFYAAWSGFATVKSFAWQDKYRLSEAPDRWYRRRMEQENQRIRLDARREFNDAVRSLVAFIRKRDPRYVPNVQSEQERQETLRNAAAAQATRARAANAAKMSDQVPEWAMAREPDELESSTDEEEQVEEVFECVACEKIFKSERQWQAHEKSKKHQKTVKALQYRMRKQNASLGLTEDGLDPDSGLIEIDDLPEKNQRDESSDEGVLVEETPAHESPASVVQDDNSDSEDVTDGAKDADTGSERKDPKVEKAIDPTETQDESEQSASENEDYASIETIQKRMQSAVLQTDDNDSEDWGTSASKPKMGKAAQKRAKKAAAAASTASAAETANQQCEVCNAAFPSRTALFKHIKDEGHAALKTVTGAGGKGKKSKGKAKR